ncbi:TPA: glycerol-3-phosphate cytidylyltransferase [Candidatus Nomurabacteria bacterium]|nr:glycerol-3-phosphate cytidylyltransferase [Candidatus Nomurabacteria bacterium]HAX65376.1 glycerol-3-phosphate cytidylyltransferase [Candidatus Nomurabacteria bacterium]HCU01566.1 glycerol-3-phosphate cytidylyltransferase [Candidatus Nomurabacteria bacterium]
MNNTHKALTKPKKITGFTCSAFDLLHAGHLLMLKEIRSQCDYLIVGLHTNPKIDRQEKNKPIESVKERKIRLQGCRYVDKIIAYNTEVDLYNLLKKIKPDIRFMGADWKNKPNYSRDKLPNMKVVYNSRNHNYSTSNLRKRIIRSENNFKKC